MIRDGQKGSGALVNESVALGVDLGMPTVAEHRMGGHKGSC